MIKKKWFGKAKIKNPAEDAANESNSKVDALD